MDHPRIVIADDHPEISAALRDILGGIGAVVGTAPDGMALIAAVQQLEPDIVIADISMPILDGLKATSALRRSVPRSKIIILTVHRESIYPSLAFQAGAWGYLLKRTAAAELPQAVMHVLAGDRYVGQGVDVKDVWLPPPEKRAVLRGPVRI
jgi:DNA-binding NarL/FixJ family response regulator